MPPPDPWAPPDTADRTTASPRAVALGQDARCHACGTPLAAAQVLFDGQGNTVCAGCLDASQAEESRLRSTRVLKGAAYGTPLLGLCGLFFSPLGVMAILQGAYVRRALRDPETARRLPDAAGTMGVAAVVGMVIGGLAVLMRLAIALG